MYSTRFAAAGRRYSWWPYVVFIISMNSLWVVAWGQMDFHSLRFCTTVLVLVMHRFWASG